MVINDLKNVEDWPNLRLALCKLNISVPLRTEGRTTSHTERWVMCRLLSTLGKHSLLAYPLTLIHQDRPDFILRESSGSTGIEVTEAVSEQYAKFCALAERGFSDNVLDSGHFRWGLQIKNTKEMQGILRQNSLSSTPWFGESPEREWALCIENTVRKKLEKLANSDFEKFPKNGLAIYNNLHMPNVNVFQSVDILRGLIADIWCLNLAFHVIYIEHISVILEVSVQGLRSYPLEDLW